MTQSGLKSAHPAVERIAVVVFGLFALSAWAQSPPSLPAVRNLATALSEPASRTDALFTVLALSRLQQAYPQTLPDQLAGLEMAFVDDRAWLDRLSMRYSILPSRSTIFDPAAWFIQQELEQHAILPDPRISPLGPEFSDLLAQLFDRSDERLAAAFLPEAVFQAEFVSTTLWQQLLDQARIDKNLSGLLTRLHAEWFDPWLAAEPPAPLSSSKGAGALELALTKLQALMASVLLPEAPDELRVRRLRFSLLQALPGMDSGRARTARQVLRLTSAISGLYDYRYLEFIESLLWVVTELLETEVGNADADSPLPQVLAEFLPRLSAVMARNFAEVDTRFNGHLATGFELVQEIGSDDPGPARVAELREQLADAVGELVMLVPEMAFYFDQPVRRRISQEIDICISVAAMRDENGQPELSRQQYDSCMESLVRLADTVVRRAELAGDPDGPFGPDQLKRELEMTPWQRINYAIGYLHKRSPHTCPLPDQPLPNPLEWSALATLMTWFSVQSPVYFQTPENQALIVRLRQQGLELLRTLAQQVDCISGAGAGFNDLVSVSSQQYRQALLNLIGGVREAELSFRKDRLQPGADVVLAEAEQQETAYRTPDLMIGPCDAARACEMTQDLEATRALIGLFPDEYLLADQTRLGALEICYDNMQWVDRRSELVRPEDPNVANYYGHLSFELVGRYREGDRIKHVFASSFTSPDEYHYLVAAARDEVLETGCPTKWVGTSVITERHSESGTNIVPNRLTYLAAARSRPSVILNANWGQGAEWRDWFVTGIGVRELEFSPEPEMKERLGRHLRQLYQAEQRSIYGNLLRPAIHTVQNPKTSLYELMSDVTMYKGLLRSQLILFYPDFLLDSDRIRAALSGQSGLLDEGVVRRFEENGVAVAEIRGIGLARLEDFQSSWKQQPEGVLRSGSVASSVAHAVARLNSIYREFFASPVMAAPASTPAALTDPPPGSGG
ncbi:MAG TPA: hypothetical protein VI566_06485 [Xanthomonadales bacterium]|nr:hypothetical protein [Xanthomonadales bacterium]